MYLSDDSPQATAPRLTMKTPTAVYLSDDSPQATAQVERLAGPLAVYLSDDSPQATAFSHVGKKYLEKCI